MNTLREMHNRWLGKKESLLAIEGHLSQSVWNFGWDIYFRTFSSKLLFYETCSITVMELQLSISKIWALIWRTLFFCVYVSWYSIHYFLIGLYSHEKTKIDVAHISWYHNSHNWGWRGIQAHIFWGNLLHILPKLKCFMYPNQS